MAKDTQLNGASPPSRQPLAPELPIEVWEQVIDEVADTNVSAYDSVRSDLRACHLVCRSWVPRCRLHLFDSLNIDSHDTLQSIASFLQSSSFHADRVHELKIRGGGPDDSWIAVAPLCLPQLHHLRFLHLYSVDLSQQHPRLSQIYSRLRLLSKESFFYLHVDKAQLSTTPATVSTLVTALKAEHLLFNVDTHYPISDTHDVMSVRTLPYQLPSYIWFHTQTSPKNLLDILRAWTRSVRWWDISIQSSPCEGPGDLPPETRRIWKEISRIFRLSSGDNQHKIRIRVKAERMAIEMSRQHNLSECRLSIELKDADDNALAYLTRILPCLALCGLSSVAFGVKKGWSASTAAWHMLDEALLKLTQRRVLAVYLMPYTAVPVWDTLPYRCMTEFSAIVLPKCSAEGVVRPCRNASCKLHDEQRRRCGGYKDTR